MNYIQDYMFLGQLPKRLIIGCVDIDALNGNITKNPFDFKHNKINFVALNVDGRPATTAQFSNRRIHQKLHGPLHQQRENQDEGNVPFALVGNTDPDNLPGTH